MKIIQIKYHINYYCNGFSYSYFIDISLELLFISLFAIMFMPFRNSKLFFFEPKFDFITEIKKNKDKNMQINNLSKKILREIYVNEEYPLILLEPFAKIDTLLSRYNIHIGIAKND